MTIQAAALDATGERSLQLTETEALALLEICLMADRDDDLVRSALLEKVGGICREFIRGEAATLTAAVPQTRDSSPVGIQPVAHPHVRAGRQWLFDQLHARAEKRERAQPQPCA